MKSLFSTVSLRNLHNASLKDLPKGNCSELLRQNIALLDQADGTFWGLPFSLEGERANVTVVGPGENSACGFAPDQGPRGRYLVFLHAADVLRPGYGEDFVYPFHGMRDLDSFLDRKVHLPYRGVPPLKGPVGEYVLTYEDGAQAVVPLEMRRQIGEWHNPMHQCYECVPHIKAPSFETSTDEIQKFGSTGRDYGFSLFRTDAAGAGNRPILWLYAWENPKPECAVVKLEVRNVNRTLLILGLTGCDTATSPLRWETRRKLRLNFQQDMPGLAQKDRLAILREGLILNRNIGCTMGQVISVQPALSYPREGWEQSRPNLEPQVLEGCYLVEYAAHDEARLILGGSEVSMEALRGLPAAQVPAESVEVTLRILDGATGQPTPAKLHLHGEHGEYITTRDRPRLPNRHWFQDYGTDYLVGNHACTYIDGEAVVFAPKGRVYYEVTKGLEYGPEKGSFVVDETAQTQTVILERKLPWRSRGWVSADTHVHFLSPTTARLEAQAEGVNVVNLLATQWGEFFTNVGDFDGRTVLGADPITGKGEYLVRVGTENRQKMLGHISLLGYEGSIITPLTTGIPDEGALGSPLEQSHSGWARQARRKNGLAVLPHYTCPQADASAIVLGLIDAVELVSWEDPNAGINPYALSDWYRYLNCGIHLPAVGGSDKMNAETAIGTSRTYALLHEGPFTYDEWKEAIRRKATFATYGPLVSLEAGGQPMGGVVSLPPGGGSVEVHWEVASVTLPITQVELVVDGRTVQVKKLPALLGEVRGSFTCAIEKPSWLALRLRGQYPDRPEIVAAHTSPIMCSAGGRMPFRPEAAQTVLELLDSQMTYLKTLAPQPSKERLDEMMQSMETAYQLLRDKMGEAAQ